MKRAAVEDLVRRLREEVDDDHWDMSHWLAGLERRTDGTVCGYHTVAYRSEEDIPHCQTAGCMAGTVFLGLTPEKRAEYAARYGELDNGFVKFVAREELDLNSAESYVLFEPFMASSNFARATRERTISMLEHLLETGVIDWGKAVPDASFSPTPLQVQFT